MNNADCVFFVTGLDGVPPNEGLVSAMLVASSEKKARQIMLKRFPAMNKNSICMMSPNFMQHVAEILQKYKSDMSNADQIFTEYCGVMLFQNGGKRHK